jgi:purine-binding chemotaxis protein CheW
MSMSADEKAEILRARARDLARRPEEEAAARGNTCEVLEFRLAHERYAVESRYVDGVSPLKDLTPLPCAPAFVRGIVNVRGQIVPVIDFKRFFELPEAGVTDLHRIVLVRGGEMTLGILADLVTKLRTLPLDEIQPGLPTLTGIRQDYLKGLTADGLIVLDLGRVLADPRLIVNEEVQL